MNFDEIISLKMWNLGGFDKQLNYQSIKFALSRNFQYPSEINHNHKPSLNYKLIIQKN